MSNKINNYDDIYLTANDVDRLQVWYDLLPEENKTYTDAKLNIKLDLLIKKINQKRGYYHQKITEDDII